MADQSDDIWREIDDLLVSGRKIPAIKLLRERTGASLVDAKHDVEARMELLWNSISDEADGNWQDIDELLYSGQKIPAIKLLRERTGASLADAKRDVEARTALLRSQSPGKFTVPEKSGCLGVLTLCLTLLAAVVWLV